MNHLGHMLLTLELLPLLLDTAASTGDGRIIFVSSSGHSSFAGPFDASKMNYPEDQYKRFQVYGNTKLYNVGIMVLAKIHFAEHKCSAMPIV